MALKITVNESLSHEEKIAKTKQEISAILFMLHTQISQGMEVVQGVIAKNPHGLTMLEVRTSYGDDVALLDGIGAKAAELLAMVEVG